MEQKPGLNLKKVLVVVLFSLFCGAGIHVDPSHLYFRSNDPRAHVDDDQVIRPLPSINKCQHPILDPKKAIRSKLVSVLFACDHLFAELFMGAYTFRIGRRRR